MRRLSEGFPHFAQSSHAMPLSLKFAAEELCDRIKLQDFELALTMYRCRGWCVRSECARDKAPRLLLCIVLLIELVRIDLGHVSARVSCLPISVLI